MVQARLKTWKYKEVTYDNNQRVLQTGFEYTNSEHTLHKLNNLQLYNGVAKFQMEKNLELY